MPGGRARYRGVDPARAPGRSTRTRDPATRRIDARDAVARAIRQTGYRTNQVARSLATGRANREIAGELFVSPHTVKRHVTHILDKLDAAAADPFTRPRLDARDWAALAWRTLRG